MSAEYISGLMTENEVSKYTMRSLEIVSSEDVSFAAMITPAGSVAIAGAAAAAAGIN